MKIVLLIGISLIACIYWFYGRKSFRTIEKDISYGPFTIRATANTGRELNMNYGMVDRTQVAYSILYQGKAIEFPDGLQSNTGLAFLWNVYALEGARQPSLIAGSQNLYLIYINEGTPSVEPLLKQSHDFASLQFLDSNQGQPGLYEEVFSKSDTANLEQLNRLAGGCYLMIGEQTVLDIQTFEKWNFHVNNDAIENYSFPAPHGALAFAPDQKSIVFLAEFQSWNAQDEDLPESENALVVYNYLKDTGYVVKFDNTATRLINIREANLQWFNRFFEWRKTQDGYHLELIKYQKLPYWTGRFDSTDAYYTLYPVKPSMLPVFLDFVLNQLGWTKANIVRDETHEYTGHCLDLEFENTKLDIRFKEDEQSLSFSKNLYVENSTKYGLLVKKIADTFDAELQSGKYQEHFGQILNETKKIRGLYKDK